MRIKWKIKTEKHQKINLNAFYTKDFNAYTKHERSNSIERHNIIRNNLNHNVMTMVNIRFELIMEMMILKRIRKMMAGRLSLKIFFL